MAIPACCRFALRVSVAIGFRLVWGQEKGSLPELYRSLLVQGNGKVVVPGGKFVNDTTQG
jgi:hypothetical protein